MTSAPSSASLNIAISGAGIGGLSTSIALARHGIRSKVVERRTVANEAGAGIQLGPNATGVLAQIEVLEAVRDVAAEPDGLSVHDGRSGRVLARFPLGSWMRQRYGAPYLTLHRQDLHHALLHAAQQDGRIEIEHGRSIVSFTSGEEAVEATFSDGQSCHADALIAADGLWSTLRPLIAASEAPRPTAKSAYRAVIAKHAMPRQLDDNNVHLWLAPGAHVVHYPVKRGAEAAIVVVIDDEGDEGGWDRAGSVNILSGSAVQKLAAPVREMILSQSSWGAWRLQQRAPLSRFANGRVALLGDAAHPVMPFFAQGGGLAIEDAIVLARLIASGGSIADQLQSYEGQRRPRAQRVTEASCGNGRIYHFGGAAALARNAALATIPGALMMRRYDWLYGWKP